MLGDSFTMAMQVELSQTFVARLAADTGVPFINAGVDAFSTSQAVRYYRRLHPGLQPEGVLLVFFLGNDITDNVRYARTKLPVRQNLPRQTGSRLCRLLRHSHLHGHWVVWREQQKNADLGSGPFRREMSFFTAAGAEELSRAMPHTRAALTALRQETSRRGHRLMVALAPSSKMIEPRRVAPTMALAGLTGARLDLDAPLRAVSEALEKLGVSTCDLTPALRAAHARGVRSYLDFDGHWTPAGHRVVARALAACLERHRLL